MAEQVNATEEKVTETAKTTATKATGKKTNTTEETKKVYNFISTNKYLSVGSLGIQFMDGKASTDDLKVAKALVNYYGVELVEK